jgi:hypothetical protein
MICLKFTARQCEQRPDEGILSRLKSIKPLLSAWNQVESLLLLLNRPAWRRMASAGPPVQVEARLVQAEFRNQNVAPAFTM